VVVSVQNPHDPRDRTLWWRIDYAELAAKRDQGSPSAPEGSPNASEGRPSDPGGGSTAVSGGSTDSEGSQTDVTGSSRAGDRGCSESTTEQHPPNPPQAGGTVDVVNLASRPAKPARQTPTSMAKWSRQTAVWDAAHPVLPATDEQKRLWAAAGAALRQQLPDGQFELWLSPLKLRGQRDGQLLLTAPDAIRGWVSDRFARQLTEALGVPWQLEAPPVEAVERRRAS
jgi:hypothetical protein